MQCCMFGLLSVQFHCSDVQRLRVGVWWTQCHICQPRGVQNKRKNKGSRRAAQRDTIVNCLFAMIPAATADCDCAASVISQRKQGCICQHLLHMFTTQTQQSETWRFHRSFSTGPAVFGRAAPSRLQCLLTQLQLLMKQWKTLWKSFK